MGSSGLKGPIKSTETRGGSGAEFHKFPRDTRGGQRIVLLGGLLTSIGIPEEAKYGLGQSHGHFFLVWEQTHIAPWPSLLCRRLRSRRRHFAAKRAAES